MDLKHYQEIAQSVLKDAAGKIRMADKIDKAIDGGAELPDAIKSLPWMVHFKSTSIHDAYAAARKTIVASSVAIDVLPPLPNAPTLQEARNIEKTLEYQFWLANRKASRRPLAAIADSASRYLAVAIQIIDNEHEYKGQKGARIDAIKQTGRFTWKVHDIRSVHPRFSDSIMEDVLLAQVVNIQTLHDKFGEEACAGIEVDEKTQKRDQWGTLYDFWNYEKRVVWFSKTGKKVDQTGGGNKACQIINEDHGLGFLPWIYVYEDDPILKAAVDTDQLENLNILLSMRYALIAATVAQARSWSKTVSGEGVPIDYSDPAAQVQLKTNEEFGVTAPAQTDPNLNVVIQGSEAQIANSTSVSRILSAMDSIASNTPYSTISALMQSALQSLIEVRQLCERGIEQGLCHHLYWSKYTKKSIQGRRLKKTGMHDETMAVGASVEIQPQDAENWPADWKVTVQLKPNSPTDRQERLNFAINAQEKMQISRNDAFELAGIDSDPDVSLAEYGDYQMKLADIQAKAKRILMKPDLEFQQAVLKLQQPTKPSMGQTPATGGPPAAMDNPNATREQITGETATGFESA